MRNAAEHGDLRAKFRLTEHYRFGDPTDQAKARELLFELAEQGFPLAQVSLAELYCWGEGGVPRDHSLAFKWYRTAADQGYPEGIYHVGRCFFEGIGVPINKTEARAWFADAAARNHFNARMFLSREDSKFFGWKF